MRSTVAKRFAFVVLVLFASSSNFAAIRQSEKRVPGVDRFCGRLISVADVNTAVDKNSRPLANTALRLYRKSGNNECCAGLSVIAEARTGRRGNFAFKLHKPEPGMYWIAVAVSGSEVSQLLRFEPPKGEPEPCSKSLFEVDQAGHFVLEVFVTVD
jgi:hypothetical protein